MSTENNQEEVYIEHMCAKHVLHPEFGEGVVLEGQHDVPDENGNIAWYNVEFDHGIETIETEDVKIMHESHHGHMMKKKKKMKEEADVTENFAENFVDSIINDKSTNAKQDFEDAITQKITQALADRKQELATSTFAAEAHHMGVDVDSKKRIDQAKKNITDVDKVNDVSGIKEAMHKKKKHDCASKVKNEQYGIGYCIPEQHTMLEDGTVTHYDVKFDHGIIENFPVDELEVIEESMHEHADNDEKNKMLEMMHKKKKQMNELGGSMMKKRAGSGQTSAY